ncbi:hypothetical protein AAF712_015861 [Marasmius tenuissimus]|uniref:F-box domain-containing protein n=1 Tax=Marasmius tenuissimus TaxID=585030 RepID=A0ABR2Z8D7_9AGAR
MPAPTFPCEILHEIISQYFLNARLLIMSHNGNVELVQGMTTQELEVSDLRTYRKWVPSGRQSFRTLEFGRILSYITTTQYLGQGGERHQVLQQIVDKADRRGRGLDITVQVWSNRRNPDHSPVLEILLLAQIGWRAFQFVARSVTLGVTCHFMDTVQPKLKDCAMLRVVINDYIVERGETTQDLVKSWQGMQNLKHLRLSWRPRQDEKLWNWGSVSNAESVLLGIRRLEVACSSATALWLLGHCRRVEQVRLSLTYEEQGFQQGAEEIDLKLDVVARISISVYDQSVNTIFTTMMRCLVCPQMHTFRVEWCYGPLTEHLEVVSVFLDRAEGEVDAGVYLSHAGPAERKRFANFKLRVLHYRQE